MPERLVDYAVHRASHAAVITLNRPEVRNALSTELVEDALTAVRQAESDPDIRSVILTGRGRAFAAGADLDELTRRDHVTETSPRSAQRRELAERLECMAKPTIAALNGHAVGGGLELALACTFRVAALEARLGLTELRVGIMPGNGGTQRLARLVGVGRALEMILLSDVVDADTARAIGLVNRVVDADSVMSTSLELAAQLAGQPGRAVAAAKESVLMSWDLPVASGIALENKWFAVLCGSPDKPEGIAAFREHRTPKFD